MRAFVLSTEDFLARFRAVADSKMRLIELAESQGHFVQAGVHFAEDGVRLVFAGGEALSGVAAGQDFDALFYRGDGIKVELAFRNRFDHLFAQHQVVHIFRGDQDALISG